MPPAWPTPPTPGAGTALASDLVHVYIGLVSGSDVWSATTAKWGTSVWGSLRFDDIVDVSCYAHGVSIDRGRKDPIGHVEPGRMSMTLDNDDGWFSPWRRVSRTGVPINYPALGPRCPVRVATYKGPLYTGFVTTVTELEDGSESVVNVTAADAFTFLADANGLALPAAGAAELTGARITRIITNALLPSDVPVSIGTGAVGMQATTLADGALEELWKTVDSDGGFCWVTADGTLKFVDRPGMTAAIYTDAKYWFTDGGNYLPEGFYVELCPTNLTFIADHTNIKNVISIACTGGTAQGAIDEESRSRFGSRTFQRHDLIHIGDAWSAVLAGDILARTKNGRVIVSPLEGDPTDDADWFDAAHTIDIAHSVGAILTRHDDSVHASATVNGIGHRISPDGWTVTYTTSPGTGQRSVVRWGEPKTLWSAAQWGYTSITP